MGSILYDIYNYLHVRKQGSFWFVYVVDNFDWWVNGKTKTFRKQKSIKYWWTKANCHQSWKTFDLSISFLNFVVYLNFLFWALYVKIKRKGNQKKLSTFFLILYQHVLLLETLFHINNWLQLQIITTHYLKCSANKTIIF